MRAVRLGQTLQLNYAKISIRSHVGNSSPALRSGLSGTVCRMQTALRYGTRLYYNYAVETRVLTLDLVSVYVIPRLRDGQCYLLMAAGVFAGVASSVSHKGLSKIARGVMNAAKRIYGVFRPAGNCCFSPVVTVRTRLGLWMFLFQKCLLEGLDVWEMWSITAVAENSFLSESCGSWNSLVLSANLFRSFHRLTFIRWTARVSSQRSEYVMRRIIGVENVLFLPRADPVVFSDYLCQETGTKQKNYIPSLR